MAKVGGEPGAAPPPPARTAPGSWLGACFVSVGPESPWGCAVSKVLSGALGRLRWRPSAADMVVFLGRHLLALLEVFKKGE